jgi:hypothetical protein
MRWRALSLAGAFLVPRMAPAQQPTLNGQISGWVTSKPETALVWQAGLRYIPEVTLQRSLWGGLSGQLDLSANGFVTGDFGTVDSARWDGSVKPYRVWLRLATHRWETRLGLQKINFGSATLFRPLMWFDRVDPRDPLQLTDGVWGALTRYYFPNNVNLWGWALYGNDDPKGWETEPTKTRTVEYGGRIQTPVPAGELGVTYHHREADLRAIPGATFVPEDRLGLDGKWNLGVGLWGEAALVRQRAGGPLPPYRRFWMLGADYTFGVGNGLYVLTEYARIEAAASALGAGDGAGFSGLLMNYPLGMLDKVSGIVYRNWSLHQWYRILTWQRTYDRWTFYLLGFWNPSDLQALLPSQRTQTFAGRGLQVLVAFNH